MTKAGTADNNEHLTKSVTLRHAMVNHNASSEILSLWLLIQHKCSHRHYMRVSRTYSFILEHAALNLEIGYRGDADKYTWLIKFCGCHFLILQLCMWFLWMTDEVALNNAIIDYLTNKFSHHKLHRYLIWTAYKECSSKNGFSSQNSYVSFWWLHHYNFLVH